MRFEIIETIKAIPYQAALDDLISEKIMTLMARFLATMVMEVWGEINITTQTKSGCHRTQPYTSPLDNQ